MSPGIVATPIPELFPPPFRNCSHPLLHSIESVIMDGFWHSRCLNDRIDLLYMIGLLASGTNTSLVAKNGTKQPWVKIENLHNFDCNFALCRGKIWQWLFYISYYGSKILHKKFQLIAKKKMKAWRWFSWF